MVEKTFICMTRTPRPDKKGNFQHADSTVGSSSGRSKQAYCNSKRVLKLSFQFQCGDDLPFLSHNCKEKHSSLGDWAGQQPRFELIWTFFQSKEFNFWMWLHYSNQVPGESRPNLIHWGAVSQQVKRGIGSYNYAEQKIYNLLCNKSAWQGGLLTKDRLISSIWNRNSTFYGLSRRAGF